VQPLLLSRAPTSHVMLLKERPALGAIRLALAELRGS
jgi:hypothetical protein